MRHGPCSAPRVDSPLRLKVTDAAATVDLKSPPLLGNAGGSGPADRNCTEAHERPDLNSEFGERLLLASVFLVFLLVLLRNAWVTEDAYVTFRTLDNLVHGQGLRWNAVERVQAFTNPLWLFTLAPFYFVFGDPYPAALVVSLLLSLGTVLLCVRSIAPNRTAAVFAIALLMSSRAFVEYSTSGLENPMTHALLALLFGAFLDAWVKESGASARELLWMSSLLGLLAVNRLDTILLGLPLLVASWFRSEAKQRHRAALGGVLPLVAWEAFSLVYYGSLVPNTAYAKLNTGIEKVELLKQGGIYFVDLLSNDPLSFLLLLLGVVAPFVFRQKRLYAPVLGLLVYLAYIAYVGGDFMSGRFFSAPVVLSCFVVAQVPLVSFQHGVGAAAVAIAISLFGPSSPLTSGSEVSRKGYGVSGIADERSYYYESTGLLRVARPVPFPENKHLKRGRHDRDSAKKGSDKMVRRRINVGFYGYAAGREVHIVDPLALGDPLLARLPAAYEPHWRVGHFDRVVPEGYENSIRKGRAQLSDPDLNRYYKKLRQVTEGPIWSFERWLSMWGLLTGRYDSLIDRQRYRFSDPHVDRPPLKWNELIFEGAKSKGEPAPTFRFSGLSVLIQCSRLERRKTFEWHYSSPKPSKLYFVNGTTIVGTVKLPATKEKSRRQKTIAVPSDAQKLGFDGIYFRGERGPFQHEIYGIELP